jgi:hypothetical protein
MELLIRDHKAISWNQLYEQGHWTKRKRLADQIHKLVWAEVKAAKLKPIDGKVEIEIVAQFKTKRLRDVDNICSKLYVDGLKLAKVIKDDHFKIVTKITKSIVIGSSNQLKIKITKK